MNPPENKKRKCNHNKKGKYYKLSNKGKRFLEVGQRGFLITCNFNEKKCVRDCYNILNHYANELYGPEECDTEEQKDEATKTLDSDNDIADDLQKEINATKEQSNKLKKRRFQAVDTGAANCVFITTLLDNPVELGMHIIKDIHRKKQQQARYLLRFIPIECVCKANVKNIIDAAGHLADKYFLKQSTTFAITYKKRYNNEIQMDGIIKDLAELIHKKNIMNKVDLDNPKKSLLLEIIKGLCCISVIEDYKYYKKYNISELCTTPRIVNDENNDEVIS